VNGGHVKQASRQEHARRRVRGPHGRFLGTADGQPPSSTQSQTESPIQKWGRNKPPTKICRDLLRRDHARAAISDNDKRQHQRSAHESPPVPHPAQPFADAQQSATNGPPFEGLVFPGPDSSTEHPENTGHAMLDSNGDHLDMKMSNASTNAMNNAAHLQMLPGLLRRQDAYDAGSSAQSATAMPMLQTHQPLGPRPVCPPGGWIAQRKESILANMKAASAMLMQQQEMLMQLERAGQ